MVLQVHHLHRSQSERIVWLCEELSIPYTLILHTRQPNFMAPDSLKSLPGNAEGTSPFIVDGDVTLGESGAIVEYICRVHGGGRLLLNPGEEGYAKFLYWFHAINANVQSVKSQVMVVGFAQLPPDNAARKFVEARVVKAWKHLNEHLKENKWLAGEVFSAADIMAGYTLGTARYFTPMSYEGYESVVRYLGSLKEREGFKKGFEKAENGGFEMLMGVEAPERSLLGFAGM